MFKTASGELVRIKYTGHLARRVFEASCSLTNDTVIVKFAKRYGKEVHDLCHAHNFSPTLLHHEHVAGGWIFLVMEKVDGLVQIWSSREKLKAKEQLQELANDLQAHGLVHGDLRGSNVLWNPVQSRIVVLDFDWAGIEGVVKYPPFMNSEVRWPRGASTRALIRAAHDRHWIDLLLP